MAQWLEWWLRHLDREVPGSNPDRGRMQKGFFIILITIGDGDEHIYDPLSRVKNSWADPSSMSVGWHGAMQCADGMQNGPIAVRPRIGW